MTRPPGDASSGESEMYRVVVNDDEQYALWPVRLDVPTGWNEIARGGREECLSRIEALWTDMRPGAIPPRDSAVG